MDFLLQYLIFIAKKIFTGFMLFVGVNFNKIIMNINISTNNFSIDNSAIVKNQIKANYKNLSNNLNFKRNFNKDISVIIDNNIDSLLHANVYDIAAKIKFHKFINKALPYIMTPENFINKGRESKVYKISDKYVAKIKRGYDENSAIHFYNFTKLPDKRFNQLDIYFGEPVIKLGNIEILKNATPSKDFLCCGTKYKGPHSATLDEYMDYENNFIPRCSNIPQESYDKFAKGLADLNKIHDSKIDFSKIYYTPDIINPNNILISDNQFRIVDKLDKTKQKEPNTLFTMLEPLLLRLSPESYANYKESLVEPRYNIYKKCLIAATKANLPLENSLKYEYSDYYLASILKTYFTDTHDNLAKMRNQGVSLENRLNYITNHIK